MAQDGVMTSVNRSKFIGGSDAAVILGVSPWKTPLQLWQEKRGEAGPVVVDKDRERRFARGKRLEPVVIDMVVDKLLEQGHEVEVLARNERYIDSEHSFLACEIDFELLIDGEHVNGDAKTVHGFARKKWGEENTDEIPVEYTAQFMHGLMITGRRRCLVAALIGLDDVAIYWVDRDDETISAIRAREIAFWSDCVIAGQPPDLLTYDDVTAIYSRDDGTAIEATVEIRNAVLRLDGIRKQITDLEKIKEALTLEIVDFIRPHAFVTFEGREIATWKSQTSTRLDQKRLGLELPEIAAKYRVETVSRVLRVKKEK